MEDIHKWLQFSGWSKAKETLNSHLKTELDVLIYHYSNGENGIRDIISIIREHGISTSYGGIHGKWKKWAQEGLLKSISMRGGVRLVKNFNLEDFGYDIPERT